MGFYGGLYCCCRGLCVIEGCVVVVVWRVVLGLYGALCCGCVEGHLGLYGCCMEGCVGVVWL